MIIHLKDNIYRKYNELTKFLKSEQNKKIIINLKNDWVSYKIMKQIPINSHYFIVDDNEFNLWLNNNITFDEVLGTRRFRYNRNPNIYRVEINQIYTNFL